jgi:pimeloyl-ACP methyl ester carboxylesterase
MSLLAVLLATLIAAPGAYRPVNGLRMYYEIHGSGPPLLLLHGGTATIASSWGKEIPLLAPTRRLIAPEQMGHGHTGDADRPLSYAQMADDTATLLGQLGVARTDVYGRSDGGVVALYLAARHPALVRKLVVAGAALSDRDPARTARWADGMNARTWPAADDYQAMSPDGAAHWPVFLAKVLTLYRSWPGLQPAEIAAIRAPALIVIGDRDMVSLEQAGQMRRALAHARLCVLPGTTHAQLVQRGAWLAPMMMAFLDEPLE